MQNPLENQQQPILAGVPFTTRGYRDFPAATVLHRPTRLLVIQSVEYDEETYFRFCERNDSDPARPAYSDFGLWRESEEEAKYNAEQYYTEQVAE